MRSPGQVNVLVCCEYSGIVRTAFSNAGFNSWSCDLLPTEIPGNHFQGDAIEFINSRAWDLIIAHPPCTFLSKVQLYRVTPGSKYEILQQTAIKFVKDIYNSPAEHIAIENPIGALSKKFRPPDQIIYPWWFGDIHSKEICLWLKNLPPLIATCYNTKRIPVANHVNSRMSQAHKSKIKSKFFPLVAEAFVNQWSNILLTD